MKKSNKIWKPIIWDDFIKIWSKINNMYVYGVTILIVIIMRKDDGSKKWLKYLNHENIHVRQSLETFIIGFILIYLINYIINLFLYKSHKEAYLNVIFEKEAFDNDDDLFYLDERKLYAWLNY